MEMLARLRKHPFPVVAHFERVVAISFAFPEEALRSMVPNGLSIDAYHGFGFITVALVWTRGLRPAGFPKAFGKDFFLAGTRIFTRLEDGSGRRLRGLKIVRSETDKRSMVALGNLMTGYNYRRVKVEIESREEESRILCSLPGGKRTLDVQFSSQSCNPGLPMGSPFPDWRAARRFAGPMPFTFSPDSDGSFLVIEGSRESWKPKPIEILSWEVGLFDEEPLVHHKPVLANAFVVENVDYRWGRGRSVRPGGTE